jgi:hypothetical protein
MLDRGKLPAPPGAIIPCPLHSRQHYLYVMGFLVLGLVDARRKLCTSTGTQQAGHAPVVPEIIEQAIQLPAKPVAPARQ